MEKNIHQKNKQWEYCRKHKYALWFEKRHVPRRNTLPWETKTDTLQRCSKPKPGQRSRTFCPVRQPSPPHGCGSDPVSSNLPLRSWLRKDQWTCCRFEHLENTVLCRFFEYAPRKYVASSWSTTFRGTFCACAAVQLVLGVCFETRFKENVCNDEVTIRACDTIQ